MTLRTGGEQGRNRVLLLAAASQGHWEPQKMGRAHLRIAPSRTIGKGSTCPKWLNFAPLPFTWAERSPAARESPPPSGVLEVSGCDFST